MVAIVTTTPRMWLRASFLPFVLGIASAGCGSAAGSYDYAKEPDPRKTEYQVGPLDQVQVIVWKNREMSGEVTVRPDGVMTLPLIGDVKAAGRTPSDLQKEIAKRYGDFVRAEEAVVSVGVSSVNSYSFTVSGNVEHAGVFAPKSYVTALEAVALAGGPNRFASDTFYVIRGTPARKIPIDIKHVTSGERPDENVYVLRGDVIVVP